MYSYCYYTSHKITFNINIKIMHAKVISKLRRMRIYGYGLKTKTIDLPILKPCSI